MTANTKLSDEQTAQQRADALDEHYKFQSQRLATARATIDALTGERDRQYEANAILIAKEGAAIIKIEALRAALGEAERFLDYFANDRREFSGPGTPMSCLAHIRWALNPDAALSHPEESGGSK